MTIWLDAHISPRLAGRVADKHGIDCIHIRDLALRDAEDSEIFFKCRAANAVLMTKDRDFVELVERHGPPPQVVWIRFGNCSNAEFSARLDRALADVLGLLAAGASIVELV